MNNFLFPLLLVGVGMHQIRGDIFLHNPRGANNRLNEATRNRQNANRLYNSQNNNRGGYNVGSLFYYGGSKLKIEWTNQHSCDGPNNHCNIVIQYTCGDMMRDGATTNTIPTNFEQCDDYNCTRDLEYGMHEDIYYYANCRLRSRNKGLFTANQRVNDPATCTRQNGQGTRYGYECQEERDYYPYWGPTPWRDIAVFTNDPSRCDMFKSESQNVKAKYACEVGNQYLLENVNTNVTDYIPITKEECEAFTYTENGETKKGIWRLYPAHGIDAPDCAKSQPSRDNHLGNTIGGETMSYDWIVPNYFHERCVLRIRYNISTSDYDRDTTDSEFNIGTGHFGVNVYSKYGLTLREARKRGYRFLNNPLLNPFNLNKLKLRLSLNNAQYGRTFQDRSHTFSIRPRPADIPPSAEILNINVRGKRGNIVQVYPAVEYDYVPNTALVKKDSYVHFQWTGSDNNPRNNDGQGRAGSDRSNVVMIKEPIYTEGNPDVYKNSTYGQLGSSYPAHIDSSALAGLSREDRVSLAIVRPQLGGDMDELDDAGTYYDLGPRKVTMSGTYHYMCTRNNNFSNRSQKGKLIVTSSAFKQQNVDEHGGLVVIKNERKEFLTSVDIPPQALNSPVAIELWELSSEDTENIDPPPNTNYISQMVFFGPEKELSSSNKPVQLDIHLNEKPSSLYSVEVYRSASNNDFWQKLEVSHYNSNKVAVKTDKGGYFVATKSVAPGPMAGLVVGLLVGLVLIIGLTVYCYNNRLALSGYGGKI